LSRQKWSFQRSTVSAIPLPSSRDCVRIGLNKKCLNRKIEDIFRKVLTKGRDPFGFEYGKEINHPWSISRAFPQI